MGLVTRQVRVCKSDDEAQVVYAWLAVAEEADGTEVVDSYGDVLDVPSLEETAWAFVAESRVAGVGHDDLGIGTVVSSVVTTRELQAAWGLPPGALPVGWFVGIHVTRPDVWARIKAGELPALSWAGVAETEDLIPPVAQPAG